MKNLMRKYEVLSSALVLSLVFLMVACGSSESDVPEAVEVSDSQAEAAVVSNTNLERTSEKPPNFLLMIGDDMSVETVGCYKIGSDPAKTPTLDTLCNSGMRFDNFWAQPVCSPTRATILSGQYGFRNGVGTPATSPDLEYPRPEKPESAPEEIGGQNTNAQRNANGMGMGMTMAGGGMGAGMAMSADNTNAAGTAASISPGLYPDAYGLPAALRADTSKNYLTAAIGKWHLADDLNGALDHPQRVGFQHYSGTINTGGVPSFYAWPKVVNGKHTSGETKYTTSVTVDDALSWLSDKQDNAPWLLWVAFNAPHSPWGPPPDVLLSSETVQKLKNDDSTLTYYQAMIEAMDTEIARLLSGIPADELENTYIIFLGDNGTPNQVVTAPLQRQKAKGGVYQGGVNVPLFIKGPGVPAAVSKSLVNSVDLFSTILELAETKPDPKLDSIVLDSVSIAPVLKAAEIQVRDFAYADRFGQGRAGFSNSRAIRNDRYKLIQNVVDATEQLYDLLNDPWEDTDLLSAELESDVEKNYQALKQRLELLVSDNARFQSN